MKHNDKDKDLKKVKRIAFFKTWIECFTAIVVAVVAAVGLMASIVFVVMLPYILVKYVGIGWGIGITALLLAVVFSLGIAIYESRNG